MTMTTNEIRNLDNDSKVDLREGAYRISDAISNLRDAERSAAEHGNRTAADEISRLADLLESNKTLTALWKAL